MKIVVFFLAVGLLSTLDSRAQYSKKGYADLGFQFPIRPHQRNYLAGGLGDLRPNHFHAGIDIKTNFQEGWPVYAAADGYIQKASVSARRYGKLLIIKHPNGYRTAYAHLRAFAEPLQSRLQKAQLIQQQRSGEFEIELNLDTTAYRVRKGDLIGFSGNSGNSAGPHLHFEIRDPRNNLVNPLLFGFPEIKDQAPPQINGLLAQPLDPNARVAGHFEKQQQTLQKVGPNRYQLSQPIRAKGLIGLALSAFDRLDGVPNINGLACVEVWINGQEFFRYHPERLPSHLLGDINVHTDFEIERTQGQKFQRLFLGEGNEQLLVYGHSGQRGRLRVEVGKRYELRIKCWDEYQNLAELKGEILGEEIPVADFLPNTQKPQLQARVETKFLVVTAKNGTNPKPQLTVVTSLDSTWVQPTYVSGNEAIFMIDLSKKIVQKIYYSTEKRTFNFRKFLFPKQTQQYHDSYFDVSASVQSLYQSLVLETSQKGAFFEIGRSSIPLREELLISYKPDFLIAQKDKTAVYEVNGQEPRWIGGTWVGEKMTFRSEEMGKFALLTDTLPPQIRLQSQTADFIAFRVSDNLAGVHRFRLRQAKQGILLDYDPKINLLWAQRSDSTQVFDPAVLEVWDREGNMAVWKKEEPLALLPPEKNKK
jgi:Peptidase family M23